MSNTNGHGGKRSGAGRPLGNLKIRSLEAIEAVAARYPDWSPLLHFAAVANDETLPVDVRLDAAKAAAPYMHPRPKPSELDPDAAIAFEKRLAAVRAEAVAKEALDPFSNLGDRLDRAFKRFHESD